MLKKVPAGTKCFDMPVWVFHDKPRISWVINLVFQQKKMTIKETPTNMKYWFSNVGLRLLGQRPIPNDKNKPNCEAIILTYFRFGTKKGNNLKYQIRSHHSPQLMEYNELALNAVLHFPLITFQDALFILITRRRRTTPWRESSWAWEAIFWEICVMLVLCWVRRRVQGGASWAWTSPLGLAQHRGCHQAF